MRRRLVSLCNQQSLPICNHLPWLNIFLLVRVHRELNNRVFYIYYIQRAMHFSEHKHADVPKGHDVSRSASITSVNLRCLGRRVTIPDTAEQKVSVVLITQLLVVCIVTVESFL